MIRFRRTGSFSQLAVDPEIKFPKFSTNSAKSRVGSRAEHSVVDSASSHTSSQPRAKGRIFEANTSMRCGEVGLRRSHSHSAIKLNSVLPGSHSQGLEYHSHRKDKSGRAHGKGHHRGTSELASTWVERPRLHLDALPKEGVIGTIKRHISSSAKGGEAQVMFYAADNGAEPVAIDARTVVGVPDGGRVRLLPGGIASNIKASQHVTLVANYAVEIDSRDWVRSYVGLVEEIDGKLYAVANRIGAAYDRVELHDIVDAKSVTGQWVLVELDGINDESGTSTLHANARGRVSEVLGDTDVPQVRFLAYATDAGVTVGFPADVWSEMEAIKKNPGIDDPMLADLTHLPFVTIDNDDSMDLDQAMCIQKTEDGGYTVHYAIADAQHFVKPGSAIDREAQRRAQTTYLPGRNMPMLPRELSEDFCSLVEGQKRRAFVVSVKLDVDGTEVPGSAEIRRAVILSHKKLSYNGVQRFFDGKETGPTLAGHDYSETLQLLRSVGKMRIAQADARGVVPILDAEQSIHPRDSAKGGCELSLHHRNEVEFWNEQISLLINSVVDQYIQGRGVTSLHRVHPRAEEQKIEHFREQVAAIGKPWPEGQALSDYIRALPNSAPSTPAIRMLASRTNEKAYYSTEAIGHAALGLKWYAHFTAPMRRYADIQVHRILADLVEGRGPRFQDDEGKELEAVAEQAAHIDQRNSRVGSACVRHVEALTMAEHKGETLEGTIINMSDGGFNVRLDAPIAAVRVQVSHLNHAVGGRHRVLSSGVILRGPSGTYQVGDRIKVVIKAADTVRDHVDALPASVVEIAGHRPLR